MNTHPHPTLALLFAACLATAGAHAADAPKGGTSAKAEPPHAPAPAPAPAPKKTEPPHAPSPAPAPAPTPAPKKAEPPHAPPPAPAPAPAPAPKKTEPPHPPAPAPKPPEPPHAPAPAPAPKPAPAPAPAPLPPVSAWDDWLNAKPVPSSFPAGVAFTKGGDSATGDRQAYYVGRTDVAVTSGKEGGKATATGAIRIGADLNAQTIKGQMGGFTSAGSNVAGGLNAMALTMSGTYDAAGKITGTTSSQGQVLGQVAGTLTTTLAQGTWTLAKNDYSVNATFRAGRVTTGH